jgi:hypothetical protein
VDGRVRSATGSNRIPAEALYVPLPTRDRRLVAAAGNRAQIELV